MAAADGTGGLPPLLGVVGWSGSGKTTLVERLLPRLIAEGLTVSTVKMTRAGVETDRPGSDTAQHRAAGAVEVALVSTSRWALMHELRGGAEPAPAEVLARLTPVDLVLAEGVRSWPCAKLEVHRRALAKPLLAAGDPGLVAVASDAALAGLSVPAFALDDADAIAAFIVGRLRLGRRRPAGP